MEPDSGRKKKSRFFPGLVIGIILGAAGAAILPQWTETYLPDALQTGGLVDGRVLDKSVEPDRLLLKLSTEHGVLLATFSQRQEEIDLLVEQDDTVSLRVSRYQPFLQDPPIERVRKPEHVIPEKPEPTGPAAPETMPEEPAEPGSEEQPERPAGEPGEEPPEETPPEPPPTEETTTTSVPPPGD